MVSKDFILQKLDPFTNTKRVIVTNQTVSDLKNGLIQWHEKYASEYDKIYKYFLGATLIDSCRNVYNFLKQYVHYNIESDNEQTLRSPAAILAPGFTVGADCKSYALFSCGIMSAIDRNTNQKCKVVFRFASYDMFSNTPKHVFCVVNPGTNSIWIDPVLPAFNQKKDPYYYSDKKANMSLIAMSGVPGYDNKQIGFLDPGSIATGVGIFNSLSSLFSNRPNPNDWQGWNALDQKIGAPIGTNAINWIINDGDSVQNEALNIVSYINAYGLNTLLGYSTWFNRNITKEMIAGKLNKAGLTVQANEVLNNTPRPVQAVNPLNPAAPSTQQAGMNMIWTLALVGGGLFAISKLAK